MFISSLKTSLLLFAAYSVLLGLGYPLAMTAASQALFPKQAQGSLIYGKDGKPLGSELIGQAFSKPEYFWGRLSATGPVPYNAAASSGSNLGVNAPALKDAVKARAEALLDADRGNMNRIPVDLVTASGSGLDPHISLDATFYQAPRVAKARGLSLSDIEEIINNVAENRQFGLLGEPRVNVLKLNLALDAKASQQAEN